MDELAREIDRQDERWGPFTNSPPSILFALANIDEELHEAREAWRLEKLMKPAPLFALTGEELLQVAAVALRAYRAIITEPPTATPQPCTGDGTGSGGPGPPHGASKAS